MKQTAAAVTHDEKLFLQVRQRKKAIVEPEEAHRFGARVTVEQKSIATSVVNTKVANDWALRNLRQWMDHHRNWRRASAR